MSQATSQDHALAMASRVPRRQVCMGAQTCMAFPVAAVKHRVVSLPTLAQG